MNTTIKFWIFELVYVPNFSKTDKFDFLDEIYPKSVFPVENRKIALLRVSMVVTYYTKTFRTGTDRHNGILMSLLLLVAETTRKNINSYKINVYGSQD